MKTYCIQNDCPLADKCLRVLKLREETSHTILVVNPQTVAAGPDCPYYVSDEIVRFGKGFTQMLAEMSRKKEDEFRVRMISQYPRNKYFKMRKGEVLCGPENQQFISSLLADLNIPCNLEFDEWVEKEDW